MAAHRLGVCARGGGRGRRRRDAMADTVQRSPIGDAHDRVAFRQPGENRGTVGAGRHEQAQLPGDDLGDEAHRLQTFDHPVGEAAEFHPEQAHHPGAAQA